MKTLLSFVFLGILAAGCSATVSGGGSGGSPSPGGGTGFFDEKPAISGPTVEGHWRSNCVRKNGSGSYHLYDLTFQGDTVKRSDIYYQDSSCQKISKNETYNGKFRFIDKYDDRYNIEYAFAIGGGLTTFPQELIAVRGEKLYLSDFHIGEMSNVITSEPLSKVTSGNPEPTPSPAPPVDENGRTVYSYDSAKFAYCSTQGFGTLIDFNGYDLTKVGHGSAKMGSKVCGRSDDIRWSAAPIDFDVTIVSGRPTIIFESRFKTSIKADAYGTGTGYQGRGADAMMGGNSGECFFLADARYKNLSFTYKCN